jgi:PhnB protein
MAGTVKPVPEGFHTITPHLVCRNAAKAVEFYKKAFGAEVGMNMPGPDGKSIMHAELKIGDSMIFLCDEYPEWGVRSPLALNGSPVTIHMYVRDADASFKRATDAGATVAMPLQNQFWGDRYGKLTDPFGHHWSIAAHVEDVSPAECAKRAAEAMSKGGCSEK